jgi:acyl-CoA reductase-like NAD-dependent aldehyde dehydrogenase
MREPFGPVDVLVAVDSEEELIREANVSDGALVASVATDDPAYAERIASRLHAFKIGVNRLRSRGDRDEPFGGKGRSWEGAFVGGSYLIDAFTQGARRPAGNYQELTHR